MKCIICHGEEIAPAEVFEETEVGSDIVRIPVRVLECHTCGERYYDRATVRRLERVREEVESGPGHESEASYAPGFSLG